MFLKNGSVLKEPNFSTFFIFEFCSIELKFFEGLCLNILKSFKSALTNV